MVRLAHHDNRKVEPRGGINAKLVDHLLSATSHDQRKRSRPATHSLDYIPPVASSSGRDPLVVPPQYASRTPPLQDSHGGSQDLLRTRASLPVMTRARGNGIPPNSIEDDPLSSFNEDAKKRSRKSSFTSQKSRAKNPRGSEGGGGSTKTVKEGRGGKRVDMLRDQGFPFMQWAVIILIVLIGIYQLYRSVTGGVASKATKTASIKKVSSKGKVAAPKGNRGGKQKANEDIAVAKVLAQIEGPSKDQPKQGQKKNSINKKKSKKTKVASNSTTEKSKRVEQPLPDSQTALDLELLVENAQHNTGKSSKRSLPAPAQADEDDAGWRVVGVAAKTKPVTSLSNTNGQMDVTERATWVDSTPVIEKEAPIKVEALPQSSTPLVESKMNGEKANDSVLMDEQGYDVEDDADDDAVKESSLKAESIEVAAVHEIEKEFEEMKKEFQEIASHDYQAVMPLHEENQMLNEGKVNLEGKETKEDATNSASTEQIPANGMSLLLSQTSSQQVVEPMLNDEPAADEVQGDALHGADEAENIAEELSAPLLGNHADQKMIQNEMEPPPTNGEAAKGPATTRVGAEDANRMPQPSTENDEALALLLQQEEEQLAIEDVVIDEPPKDETWAEVKTKKKRSKAPEAAKDE